MHQLEIKVLNTPKYFESQRIHHQGVMTCTVTDITCNGSQIFIMCVVGAWRHILNLWHVCVCVVTGCGPSQRTNTHTHTHTHTPQVQNMPPNTNHAHINICETLQVISLKVQVITPWWWILCDTKHVGVIFNYVFFKLLYNTDFNSYVLL